MTVRKPIIVIISLRKEWLGVSRLPRVLQKAGFRVEAICHPGSYLAKTRYIDKLYPIMSHFSVFSKLCLFKICHIISKIDCIMIIPGDEDTILLLQDLYKLSRYLRLEKTIKKLQYSLWKREQFFEVLDKHRFINKLNAMKMPVPQDLGSAKANPTKSQYPVVLKDAFGSGGSGVWLCRNQVELANIKKKILPKKSKIAKQRLKKLFFYDIFSMPSHIRHNEYVSGIPGMFPFVALKGQYIGGYSLLKIRTFPETTGPSSVVRLIQHKKIEEYVKIIINNLEFSGFGSFDFIYNETTNDINFIELNPRPVPVSHLGDYFGIELCEALFHKLTNTKYTPKKVENSGIVALFPSEYNRDPESIYIKEHHHDVPIDDPELLEFIAPEYQHEFLES